MLDSLAKKVCLVTGASSGIGKATCMRLAEKGATVVMVCRNSETGGKALEEIKKKIPRATLDLLTADLSRQSAVRQLSADFLSKYQQLHILVNNAGLALRNRVLSDDQIEMTFAVNHLAYFLLTNLLLDRLKAGAPARIINVSSEAHRNAGFDSGNLQGERSYGGFKAYSITKLCNVLFTYELARKLNGTGVTVNAMHPGFLSTGIFRSASGFLRLLVRMTAGSPDSGANAILYLATAPELQDVSGKYFNGTRQQLSSPVSRDPAAAAQLWEISAKLVQLPNKN